MSGRATQLIDATRQQVQNKHKPRLETNGEDVKPQLLGQQERTQLAAAGEPTFIGDALRELRQALTEFRARAEELQVAKRQKEERVLLLCKELLEPKAFLPHSELNEVQKRHDSYSLLPDSKSNEKRKCVDSFAVPPQSEANEAPKREESTVQSAETPAKSLPDGVADDAPVAHVEANQERECGDSVVQISETSTKSFSDTPAKVAPLAPMEAHDEQRCDDSIVRNVAASANSLPGAPAEDALVAHVEADQERQCEDDSPVKVMEAHGEQRFEDSTVHVAETAATSRRDRPVEDALVTQVVEFEEQQSEHSSVQIAATSSKVLPDTPVHRAAHVVSFEIQQTEDSNAQIAEASSKPLPDTLAEDAPVAHAEAETSTRSLTDNPAEADKVRRKASEALLGAAEDGSLRVMLAAEMRSDPDGKAEAFTRSLPDSPAEDEPLAQGLEDAPVVMPDTPAPPQTSELAGEPLTKQDDAASPQTGELVSEDGELTTHDTSSKTEADDVHMSVLAPRRRVHSEHRNSGRRAQLLVDDAAKAHELLAVFERRRDAEHKSKLVEKADVNTFQSAAKLESDVKSTSPAPRKKASFAVNLEDEKPKQHEHVQADSPNSKEGSHADSDPDMGFTHQKTMGFSKLARFMGLRGTLHAGDGGAHGGHNEPHVWYCTKCTNANNMNRFKCTDCGTQREKLVEDNFIAQASHTLSDWDFHRLSEPPEKAEDDIHPGFAPARRVRSGRMHTVPVRRMDSGLEVDEQLPDEPMSFKPSKSEGVSKLLKSEGPSKLPDGDDKRKSMGFSKLAKIMGLGGKGSVLEHPDHNGDSHGGHAEAHVWHCHKCTNENNMLHQVCTDCGARREKATSRAHSREPSPRPSPRSQHTGDLSSNAGPSKTTASDVSHTNGAPKLHRILSNPNFANVQSEQVHHGESFADGAGDDSPQNVVSFHSEPAHQDEQHEHHEHRKSMGFSSLARVMGLGGTGSPGEHAEHHGDAHGGHADAHVWHCPKCTNENNMFHSRCTDCGAHREDIVEKTAVTFVDDTHELEDASPHLDGSPHSQNTSDLSRDVVPSNRNACHFMIPTRRVPSARRNSGRRAQLFVDDPEKARNLLLTIRRGRREAVVDVDVAELQAQQNPKVLLPDLDNRVQRHAATFHCASPVHSPYGDGERGAVTFSGPSMEPQSSDVEVRKEKTLGFRTLAKIMGLRHHAAVKLAADEHEGEDDV